MVAEMLKSKEKLFRRLCKEPMLYFEAYKILGSEEKAEEVCITVLERLIRVYPVLKRKSYDDLLKSSIAESTNLITDSDTE